jgi:protein SCO1
MTAVARRSGILLLASALLAVAPGLARSGAAAEAGLPSIGAAPAFTLTRETGAPFAVQDLAGKVAVVTFIYTNCPDVCPLLTQKLVEVQDKLGAAFGRDAFFVSITLDPEVDRPAVLQRFAENLGSNPNGWAYLTGTDDEIAKVARAYGVVFHKQPVGEVEHGLLTSLVDRSSRLRVQYLGVEFDSAEFERDLRSLIAEAAPP